MVLKVVTMAELRMEVLLEAERTGMTVSEVCRPYGISRQTYYRYRSGTWLKVYVALRPDKTAQTVGKPIGRSSTIRWCLALPIPVM